MPQSNLSLAAFWFPAAVIQGFSRISLSGPCFGNEACDRSSAYPPPWAHSVVLAENRCRRAFLVRALLTVISVAVISYCLSCWKHSSGERIAIAAYAETTSWVRTSSGWERNSVLNLDQRPFFAPALHPSLVACFQLGISLFALLAFPSSCLQRENPATVSKRRSGSVPRQYTAPASS